MDYIAIVNDDHLSHYGRKGQKWGYRRWQNEDGSLTPAGREHYGKGLPKLAKTVRGNRIKNVTKAADKNQRRLDKASAKSKQAELKATTKKGNAARAQLKYDIAARKSDNAIFLNEYRYGKMKRKEAALDRANKRARKAEQVASSLSGKVAKLEARQLRLDAKKQRRTRNYIKRYSQLSYDELVA